MASKSRRRNVLIILLAVGVSFVCSFLLTRHFLAHRQLASYPGLVGEALFILRNESLVEVKTSDLLSAALASVKEKHDLPTLATGFDESYSDEQVLQEFGHRRQQILDHTDSTASEIDYELLKGLGEGLKEGDPYCSFMNPEEYARFKEQMAGESYSGIGVTVELRSDRHVVVKVFEGAPAAQAGVKEGDLLVSVDGRLTQGQSLEAVTGWIRGPEGSQVRVTVHRGSEKLDFAVTRSKVVLRSVDSSMLTTRIGYSAIAMFGETTAEEFREDLERLRSEGARALVIDLRGNGGGYIDAATEVLSAFLPTGTPLVSVVNERTHRDEPTYARGDRRVDWPLVVLVDSDSASASEIAAGALKDHRRALLVGGSTYGKGSVQSLHVFGDGGAFKYTVAHYLTPNGDNIERKGIRPDVEVDEALQATRLRDEPPVARAIESLERQLARLP